MQHWAGLVNEMNDTSDWNLGFLDGAKILGNFKIGKMLLLLQNS